ncbi:MAG: hypothetical protein K2J99_16790 [Lachnospiraceae bacterium]|nr:hypothetical protein [Lachnospiraceae bacterium]
MRGIYAEKVSLETAREIYETYMKVDFPPEEIKPFPVIKKMWEKNSYFVYAFYENASEDSTEQNEDDERVMCAYAFLLADNKNHVLLLDYFAVCAQKRGTGYGSCALSLMRETCADWNALIVEVENDEMEDIDDKTRTTRKRRISFYTEAGCHMTDVKSRLWGVDYRIMVLPLSDRYAGEHIEEKLVSLYRGMYDEKKLKENFVILSE